MARLPRALYRTVLAQSYSPCGRYLLAASHYGELAVFDLDRVINPTPDSLSTDYNKAKKIHTFDNISKIHSLVTTERFLVIGAVGEISGWDWKLILGSKPIKQAWSIKIPSKNVVDQVDVNSLWLSEDKERLYAGCGDNNVYSFHLEEGKLMQTFAGHEDYVHCVHGREQGLVSASEDGRVKLWDTRSSKASNTIEPHKKINLARPELGKWVGAAALGADWIVCGGGPRLALWHLRSLEPVTVMELPDHGIHVASFNEDNIIAAGTAKHLYLMDLAGEIKVELPVSATTVYSAAVRDTPSRVFCVAGSSSQIDLCTTFNYRDQVLYFK